MSKLRYFYPAFEYIQLKCEEKNTELESCLSIYVVKVNPESGRVSDIAKKNTETEVWLEFGFPEYVDEVLQNMPVHDIELDCGAPTFEEAIVKLANLIKNKYGK